MTKTALPALQRGWEGPQQLRGFGLSLGLDRASAIKRVWPKSGTRSGVGDDLYQTYLFQQ